MTENPYHLENHMPYLHRIEKLVDFWERFFATICNGTFASIQAIDVIYNAYRGDIRTILNNSRNSEAACREAKEFIDGMSSNAEYILKPEVFDEYEELQRRLTAIHHDRVNMEDPLGW